MTLYIEPFHPYPRVTCLDPLFLGFMRPDSFALGTCHTGHIDTPYPGGYGVRLGTRKGFLKTQDTYTQGKKFTLWIARESVWEKNIQKPLRVQLQPVKCPFDMYEWQAFIKSHPSVPIEVKEEELWQKIKCLKIPNPLFLNQTRPCPRFVQEAWDICIDPVLSWKGGYLVIEEGRTLTAIDINTSSYGDGGHTILMSEASIQSYWYDVIPIVLDAIRVRMISGIIIVDLPRLPYEKGVPILKSFQKNLKALELNNLGLTRGGLWEMTRPRRLPSIKQQRDFLCP